MSDTKSILDKSSLGALDPSYCLLLLCDIQEKYHNRILHFEQVVENARKLVETAHLLDIPVIATEQLPDEGWIQFERTVGGIRRILKSEPICKTKYSMVGAECVRAQMAANSRRTTVILAGMETHIAINQTCIDLLARKYKVHIVADSVSSRTQTDRHLALGRMDRVGAFIQTTESVLTDLMGGTCHQYYHQIKAKIDSLAERDPTGLVFSENDCVRFGDARKYIP